MCDEDAELAERRNNEFEALKSIFGNDLYDLREVDVWKVGRPPEMRIHLEPLNTSKGVAYAQCFVELEVNLSLMYPKDVPQIKFSNCVGISQDQQDALLKKLKNLADNLKGEEMVYELCMEVQNYLSKHGSKAQVFSSFHEEMEERQKTQERSGNQNRLATLDLQVIADEIVERQREIEEEEERLKDLESLKLDQDLSQENQQPSANKEKTESRRSKQFSESEDSLQPAERICLATRGKSIEVVRGRLLDVNSLNGGCYSGIILDNGQMIAIHRWFVVSESKSKKVKFSDTETDLIKQISAIESEIQNLTKLQHPNLVRYIGISRQECVKEKKLYLNLMEEFCRGNTLDLYISGKHRIEMVCLQDILSQVLLGLDFLHSSDIIHRNLRHTSIFLEPDQKVKIADYSVDLKLRDLIAQANKVELEDEFPPSVGRGGKKCDIYRLGLILISVIDGSIVRDQVPKIPASIPSSLRNLLAKCLITDEKERWSAEQLLEHNFFKDSMSKECLGAQTENTREVRSDSPDRYGDVDAPIEPIKISDGKESRLIQDFKILSWIGRGGFGDVIQVKNKLDDQVYAIKRIRLNPADRQLNRKIMREVKLLSRLNHENVVRYYNSWQELTTVCPTSGEEDTTTTEETDGQFSRCTGNSMSLLGFQPSSFRSPVASRLHQEDSEWSVSFMPPDSDDSDSDSDQESSSCPVMTSESDSERIIFGSVSSSETSEQMHSHGEQSKLSETSHEEKSIEINTLYIQMEFCEKKTLRNYIDDGLYKDTKKVWQMFREIIDGLVHIHTQGMIHRDLKPVNIFLDRHDHVKIGDFGLATTELLGSTPLAAVKDDIKKEDMDDSVDIQEDMTGLVGTALYTAPEVTQRNATYNQKVDLYSLGVIFFEMCYHPLQTGMERIKVLTALRGSDIQLPEDWDTQLLTQQTYIVNWLLDHDHVKRPTSQELLLSDYLPPPQVEESRMEETVRNAMKNKKSKAYRQLISWCLAQNVSQARDIYFDTDYVKTANIRRLGAAHAHFYSTARCVFTVHGAVPLDTHLLVPVNSKNPWKGNDTCVQVMTRNGDVVSLPHDLRIPFARYLARQNIHSFKRYSFGKVLKEKKVFGLHPKEYMECGFDIVSPVCDQVEADAELLVVCQDLINQLGDWEDTKFMFRLSHGALTKGLLLHLGVDEKLHCQVVDLIKTHSKHRSQLAGRLQNIGVSEASIAYLATLLEADTGLNQLTSLLRPVTKRRGEAAQLVKTALNQLKQVEATAVRYGLKFEVQFSVHNLYPPSLYSGVTFQLIRMLTKKTTRNMDIVGAGGRYNDLVKTLRDFLRPLELADSSQAPSFGGRSNRNVSDESEDEVCATGFSLSVDRLAAAIVKQHNFVASVVQVLVSGDSAETCPVLRELWTCGVSAVSLSVNRMDELREIAKDLAAEIIILITAADQARVAFGDKEGRFLGEKKMSVCDAVLLVTRELKLGGGGAGGRATGGAGGGGGAGVGGPAGDLPLPQVKEDKIAGGPKVVYNFNYIDREKYSASKKKLEIRKSEKLASALSRFDSSCEVVVLALGLPATVVKAMASSLECDDEDKFDSSLADLNKQFPRHRKYLDEVCSEISDARFNKKTASTVVLVSLDDNSFKIIH